MWRSSNLGGPHDLEVSAMVMLWVWPPLPHAGAAGSSWSFRLALLAAITLDVLDGLCSPIPAPGNKLHRSQNQLGGRWVPALPDAWGGFPAGPGHAAPWPRPLPAPYFRETPPGCRLCFPHQGSPPLPAALRWDEGRAAGRELGERRCAEPRRWERNWEGWLREGHRRGCVPAAPVGRQSLPGTALLCSGGEEMMLLSPSSAITRSHQGEESCWALS